MRNILNSARPNAPHAARAGGVETAMSAVSEPHWRCAAVEVTCFPYLPSVEAPAIMAMRRSDRLG